MVQSLMMNKEGWAVDELISLLCNTEEEEKKRDRGELIVTDVTSVTEHSYMKLTQNRDSSTEAAAHLLFVSIFLFSLC